MIKVKKTVSPKNLVIMAACANVAQELGITVYITSGSDSKHMSTSKHYTYEALDIRSKDMAKGMKYPFLARVLGRLGSNYDGFLENENKDNEHFHIEYDPK